MNRSFSLFCFLSIFFIVLLPAHSFGADPTKVCVGSTITLHDAGAGTWSSNNLSLATVNASGEVTGVAAGGGTVVISHTLTGSGIVHNKNITVNAVPTLSGPSSVCIGSSIPLTVTISTGVMTGDKWSSSDITIATVSGALGTAIGKAAGTDTILYTTAAGCVGKKAITVPAVATAAITGAAFVCVNDSITLTGTPAGGTWVSGTLAIATISPAGGVVKGIYAGNSMITYTYTNPGVDMCISKAYKQVTAMSLPGMGAITGPASVCIGDVFTLANGTAGGTWSTEAGTEATVLSPSSGTVRAEAGGIAVISYTLTGSNGCKNVRLKAVIVNALADVPDIGGGAGALCTGSTLLFTDAATGGTSKWIIDPSSVATVNTTTGLVTGVTAGDAMLSYKFTSSTTGCTNYATTPVTVHETTPAMITGSAVTCVGSTTTLSGDPAGGEWTSSVPAKATIEETSGMMTGVAAGATMISYTYTNTDGCTSMTSVTGTVNTPPVISGAATVCVGATTALSATPGGTWVSNNPDIATVTSSGVVTGVVDGPSVIVFTATATGCTREKTVTVKALPTVPDITGSSWTICRFTTATFSESTTGGTHMWITDPASIASVNAATGVVTGVSPGVAALSYKYTLDGCTDYAINSVTVTPRITVAGVDGPGSVEVFTTVTLTDATPGGEWISGDPAKATVDASGTVYGATTGVVTILYQVGCDAAAHFMVIDPVNDDDDEEEKHGNTAASGQAVAVYPNPTTGVFKVKSSMAGVFAVYTLEGKELQSMSVAAGTNTVSLPQGIAPGVYIGRFIGTDGSNTMVRLVYEQ